MALTEPPIPTPDELVEADAGRRRAIFGLVGGFLVVLVIIVTVQWATDNDDPTGAGDPLPDLVYTTLDGQDFSILSIEGQPTDVLLRIADRALYHSKNEGGNQVTVWTPALELEPTTGTKRRVRSR